MIDMEHEPAEPLRLEKDVAGAVWLRGYVDAAQSRGMNPPDKHVESYLRGFIAGLLARREPIRDASGQQAPH
jgi:hypothetical protein